MDIPNCRKTNKDVSILAAFQTIICRFKADIPQTLQEFDKIASPTQYYRQKHFKKGHLNLRRPNVLLEDINMKHGNWFQTNFGKNNKTFLDFSAGVAEVEFQKSVWAGWERKSRIFIV